MEQYTFTLCFTAKGHLYIVNADSYTTIIAHILSLAINPQYNIDMQDAAILASQIKLTH